MLPQNLIFFKENQKGPQPEILFVILGLFKQPLLLYKIRHHLLPCSSSFAKSYARLACSGVNALTTAHSRYQLFASYDGSTPTSEKPKKSFSCASHRKKHNMEELNSRVVLFYCFECYVYDIVL